MKKLYQINGMHCKACELLVKKTCEKACDCTIEKVDHRKGTLLVDWSSELIDEESLSSAVVSCGYTLGTTIINNEKKTLSWIDRGVLLLVALVLTFVLIKVDLVSAMPAVQSDNSLWLIFLLGLVASVSTCLAVTGGVIIGFTELVDKTNDVWGDVKLHGGFQLGRVLGFFLLGSVLGYLGNVISISFGFASWLNAFIAIVFVYLGLQLLGIVPALSSLGIHLPDKWSHSILSQNNSYLAPLVGALTFFLPCGFTQSVQLMALASGSRLMGGLMMAVFALGTLPGLLALGMGTSFAKDHRKQGFELFVAVILLIFGMFTFWGTATLWGWTDALSEIGSRNSRQRVENIAPLVREEILLSHNGYQLVPETTTLVAGKNYEIVITPIEDGLGCMTTMTLPRIDNTVHYIKKGETISYQLDNVEPGQISFVCASMGMSHGKIIIE